MPEQLDDFDRSLRDRIGAAEARVRVSSTAPAGGAAAPGPSRWLRPVLAAATAAVAVVLAVLVIGQLPDRSVGDATPSPSAGEGVSASVRNGDFVLTLSSPRSMWSTEDAIEITATLTYDGDEPEVVIGGGGGPVVFSLVQLEGGNAVLAGGQDQPCLRYPLGPDAPLVWPFQKAGGHNDEPPFDRAFFEDPELRLLPGRWEVRAALDYGVGDCGGDRLEVAIQIGVMEAAEPPGPSAVATEPPVSSSLPSPPEAALEVLLRDGNDATIRYVEELVQHRNGFVAVVNTLHTSFVPATGPDTPYSADIYIGDRDGIWRRVDTGSTFDHTRLTMLLQTPDGLLIAYGITQDYPEGVNDHSRAWTSVDGERWTEIAVPDGISAFASFAAGPRGFLATVNEVVQKPGVSAVSVYWSADGLSWERTHRATVEGSLAVYDAGAGDEGFVIVGWRADGARDEAFSLASADGRTWFESPAGELGDAAVVAVGPIGGDWIATGIAREGEMPVWWSADGLQWERSATIRDPGGFAFPDVPEESLFGTPSSLVSAGGRLFLSAALAAEGVDTRPRAMWTSSDGVTWELIDLGGEVEVRSVVFTQGRIMLGGRLGDVAGDAVIWQADDRWFD